MKHRVCLPELARFADAAEGAPVTLDQARAHYLGRVLRLKPGDEIGLCDGRGREWRATLTRVTSRSAAAELVGIHVTEPAPTPLVLAQAWLKGGAAQDTVVQKAVELGATAIRLFPSDRSPRRRENRLAHLERVITSAVEQCETRWLPALESCRGLDEVLSGRLPGCVLWLDPGQPTLDPGPTPVPTMVLVGPEGGWSDAERRRLAADESLTPAALGALTLRAETAPLAALAAIRHSWGWRR